MSGLLVEKKQFYLVTVDYLQGFSILFFVIWHTLLWWDGNIDTNWPNIEIPVAIFMAVALVVPPFFFFLYAFNIVNSLLRKTVSDRKETRIRFIKKTIIFFFIAELTQGIVGLEYLRKGIVGPEYLINFLLTWEIFHMFALTSLFFLVVFEIAWQLEQRKQYNYRYVVIITSLLFLLGILVSFLLFHDYSSTRSIHGIYVESNLKSMFERTIFESGQNPLIPFFSFPILGGLIATFLNLPNEKTGIALKKAKFVLKGSLFFLITGFLLLGVEWYVSTPLRYIASSSFIFITIGFLIFATIGGVIIFDLDKLSSRRKGIKMLIPVLLVSHISLTVFIIHNILFFFPSELQIIQLFLSSETIVLIFGLLYSFCFIIIAFIWQKWNFKYSLEWMITKLQRTKWIRLKKIEL